MDTKSSLRAAIGCAAIHKQLKKFCKSEFFTGLLHQNLQFFFVMMKKNDPCNNASNTDKNFC
ncbi:MAG TPA: hypothetical protein LFV92_04540 [Rickettsia endosymbiont of Ceroptres masudai]|nr:hypothetical protein [Rickettsia endosymbiont of Ceroptres masudai]